MNLLRDLLSNIIISAVLLYIFNYYKLGIIIEINGTSLFYTIGFFLVLGAIFRVFNYPIKRILKILSYPVNILTLGICSLIINIIIFYGFAYAINTFFPNDITIHLGNIVQTFILSCIMALGQSILKKII